MKYIVFFCFWVFISEAVVAQVCNIDYSQTVVGIYPDTLPQGTVGQAYNTDVTFVMPLDTMGYDFTNFHILSLSLPIGLDWQCNNEANGCNYDPQVSQHGCVNVFGTPLLAGQYLVDVTVIADLTVAQGYPFTFQVFLEILPNNVGTTNDGFSMNGAAGCSPISVEFTNNNPGLLYYAWDFGNGNSSNQENPAPQVYTAPGNYVVHYEAYDNLDVLNVYTLTGVTVNSMSNYGGGFPSYDNADTYFLIKENGNTIYSSSVITDQNPPVSWTTSILLNEANTYTIEVFDADESIGEVLFGADDNMGQHTMMLTGCNGCGTTGGDGPANISYTISHQIINPSPTVISEDTVHVYGYPDVPLISYDTVSNILSTPDLGLNYQWYMNGEPLSWSTTNEHAVYLSGVYQVIAVNSQGCLSISDTITGIYCDPFYNPTIALSGDSTLYIENPESDLFIQWYYDNALIPNENQDSISVVSSGLYQVELVDSFGCSYSSNTYLLNLSLENAISLGWKIFPNPASTSINIQFSNVKELKECFLLDNVGRIVQKIKPNSEITTIDIQSLPKGIYCIQINSNGLTTSKRFVKN